MTDTPDATRHHEYYADATFVRWTPFTFRLEVGRIGDADGLGRIDAIVNMSPQMALSLAQLLQDQVDKYQSVFGPINLVPREQTSDGTQS